MHPAHDHILEKVVELARRVRHGLEEEQVQRLLELHLLLTLPTRSLVLVDGFVYNGGGFDFEIRIDEFEDFERQEIKSGFKLWPKPTG